MCWLTCWTLWLLVLTDLVNVTSLMENQLKYVDNDAEISIHVARSCDFADIVAMSHGIEDGFDYLPSSFWSLLHDPRSFMFVGQVKNKVVSFLKDKGCQRIEYLPTEMLC